ncbi:HTTM domain-containing protein [Saccharopolyspora aridisoli]|uniref:HTTM domain-containing protein n=1 Tax=Saccharopolyspora aridisoli TaxID=2530385 RepID=A0A4R4ULS5_9PSEU|nr:HTTM domain-containing protein [Saccharopolyspora aridisoli]TDC92630.1 HTTM domain-containing protein [Saccharopolyspora aridisoli]
MATEQAPLARSSSRTTASRTGNASRRGVFERFDAWCARLADEATALHAAAVLRIGYGLLYLVFLLREFPHRDEIWGPGSPWTPALARQLSEQTGWISILTLSDDRAYFESCYALALITSALFMLGWRTRAVSILFAVVISFHGRAIFMSDGGDNLILLMAIYLCFIECGRRWSLDARRARLRASGGEARRSSGRPEASYLWCQVLSVRRQLTTVVHNCGMFVIAAQICIVYGASGLFKVQGEAWENGTALHYVLNLELFQPWPALSLMMDSNQMVVAAASYLTVLLQVAFPFVLFSRAKLVVLTMLLGMHVGIAVLLGLPLFSGAMIIADAMFVPHRYYRYLGQLWRRAFARPGGFEESGDSTSAEPALVPPRAGSAG